MAVACTFRYEVQLGAEAAGLGGRCKETLAPADRPVAPLLGAHPRLSLNEEGLSLCTDVAERPRFWHAASARLRRPGASAARCRELAALFPLAREADALQFALGMTSELAVGLGRAGQFVLAVGDPLLLVMGGGGVGSLDTVPGVADALDIAAFGTSARVRLGTGQRMGPYEVQLHRADSSHAELFLSIVRAESELDRAGIARLITSFTKASLSMDPW